ncbi:type I-E CRISPR-associated protein Cas5/CasD [Gardnerella sp. DNF01162]|uniref:type I-E CRISPR-associated protein Cas5/CasD n=1 Tax=Gardnerella TaxID=2701 RepID=UPI000C99E06E|nr:type I-E CRISPR-associated protein Cas5/CasD [Gardnerella sp. DNF01162]PMC43930.1 type I-E CRISPR-associated protein Cas5/CasD [Gardnerella vaginalis]PNP91846.1 type I-E CRISPR-associated protein Cas5/CasD [Gardnerella sp. DNF01162]RFD73041.1 type I-E CRISPR-associated protein Cas5/CasD [Gardnerella vaginalis]
MKSLLLKFAGPLQSWGTDSHFETRHTDYYPSKSAVVGMIAAAFGYRRSADCDEEIAKLNDLDFAVRIDQQGNLLRDYHIAAKYKSNGDFEKNYVTNRYYLEDAIFLVAIGSDNEKLIDSINDVLRSPYFQSSLGRRSLPPTADFILGVEDCGVIQASLKYKWLARKAGKNQVQVSKLSMLSQSSNESCNAGFISLYADSDLVDKAECELAKDNTYTYKIQSYVRKLRKDYVNSFSNKERKFGFRYESKMEIPIEKISHNNSDSESSKSDSEHLKDSETFSFEHDAFSGLED